MATLRVKMLPEHFDNEEGPLIVCNKSSRHDLWSTNIYRDQTWSCLTIYACYNCTDTNHEKIMRKYTIFSPIISNWEYFCQNWRIIRQFVFSFWENLGKFDVFFLIISHDFCQCVLLFYHTGLMRLIFSWDFP